MRGQGLGSSGQWSVVSGQWSVVSGQWSVVSGQWSVVEDSFGGLVVNRNRASFWNSPNSGFLHSPLRTPHSPLATPFLTTLTISASASPVVSGLFDALLRAT